jgi:hypothetical protein
VRATTANIRQFYSLSSTDLSWCFSITGDRMPQLTVISCTRPNIFVNNKPKSACFLLRASSPAVKSTGSNKVGFYGSGR